MVKKPAARSGKFKRSQAEAQEISDLEARIEQLESDAGPATLPAAASTSG
jgi:hypothetical protein